MFDLLALGLSLHTRLDKITKTPPLFIAVESFSYAVRLASLQDVQKAANIIQNVVGLHFFKFAAGLLA